MSIADKLKTVAQKMEDVYRTGLFKYAPKSTASGETILLENSAPEPFVNLKPYGNSWQNGTPSPTNHIPIESAKEVKVYGKNLLDESTITSVNVSGGFCYHLDEPLFLKGGQTYTAKIYGCSEYPQSFQVYRQSMDTEENVFAYSFDSDTLTFALEEDTYCVLRAWWRDDNNIPSLDSVRTQLELGEYATNYEPYTEQTLTLPYELNGADGVYDEIDFDRKKFIQRWLRFRPNKTLVFDSEHADTPNRYALYLPVFMDNYQPFAEVKAFCSRANWSAWGIEDGSFFIAHDGLWYRDLSKTIDEVNSIFAEFGTDIEFVAQLSEPIETDLTDEQIYAFKRLRANSPNTTIVSDAEVGVEYIVKTE